MDALKLQAKIYAGYSQAAKRLGLDNVQYRPVGAGNPLATAGATIKVSYNAEDMKFGKANKYGNPVWFGLFDGRITQPGDYLVGPQGTFFIASQQLHLPIQCVQCNRIINVLRPPVAADVGALGYGGTTQANETMLMEGWPASVLQGTKGEKGDAILPGDARSPWWTVLMPAVPGVNLRTADIITDDIGRRYTISSAELTDMGWRMTVMQAVT